jgi:hypothetical protein
MQFGFSLLANQVRQLFCFQALLIAADENAL